MSASSRLRRHLPTEGLSYEPDDPVYWEPALLEREIRRVFKICNGCRMCSKLCASFSGLFDRLDQQSNCDVDRLDGRDIEQVVDDCIQCKLCEIQCPYTPRDGHPFAVDFARLIHRFRAVRARNRRPTFRDQLLGAPDAMGRLARASLGVVNPLNGLSPPRWILEKMVGIHRGCRLPTFAMTSFERWVERSGHLRDAPVAETVLFHTCFIQNNEPQLGRDILTVLARNQVDCACVAGLRCCGMPAWEQGDIDGVRGLALQNLDVLTRYVETGAKVLVPSPTCAMILRDEVPRLLSGRDRRRAQALAAVIHDPCEYLWSIRKEPRFNTRFRSTPGTVAYHAPCHLRIRRTGFKGRDLLRNIPGVRLQTVLECCGRSGTHGLKVEHFETARRMGERAFAGMKGARATTWATDCPSAALQLEQHAGVKPLHPIEILARAYRADGFPTRAKRDGDLD